MSNLKMSIGNEKIENINNAIKGKLRTTTNYTLDTMPNAIRKISTEGVIPSGTLTITEKGEYDVTNYENVIVNIVRGWQKLDDGPGLGSYTVTWVQNDKIHILDLTSHDNAHYTWTKEEGYKLVGNIVELSNYSLYSDQMAVPSSRGGVWLSGKSKDNNECFLINIYDPTNPVRIPNCPSRTGLGQITARPIGNNGTVYIYGTYYQSFFSYYPYIYFYSLNEANNSFSYYTSTSFNGLKGYEYLQRKYWTDGTDTWWWYDPSNEYNTYQWYNVQHVMGPGGGTAIPISKRLTNENGKSYTLDSYDEFCVVPIGDELHFLFYYYGQFNVHWVSKKGGTPWAVYADASNMGATHPEYICVYKNRIHILNGYSHYIAP